MKAFAVLEIVAIRAAVWPAGMPVRVQMHLHATDGVVWSVASSEWMEPEHVWRQIHVSWVLPQKVLQRCAYY